jgi:hypothetical protein
MNELNEISHRKENEVEKKRRNEPPQKHFECLLKSVFLLLPRTFQLRRYNMVKSTT